MMDVPIIEDQIIKTCIELLSSLISPFSRGDSQIVEIKELDDALYYNLSAVRNSDTFKKLQNNQTTELMCPGNQFKYQSRWAFVGTCLYLMNIVRDTIQRTKDEKLKLLSVSEKKILQSTFQFVIALGVLQYLLPGVGVSLEEKCKSIKNIAVENLNDFAKYRRLCFVIDSIMYLYTVDVFHDLIITKHLEDVLAALFQLSFCPLKKPILSDADDAAILNLESLDDNYEIDRITYTVWSKLEENKRKYKKQLVELQTQLYRPLLIRTYLLLLGCKKTSPRWMKPHLTTILTSLVLEEGGVMSTIKGVVGVDAESPIQSSHCASVAKLVSDIFCGQSESNVTLLAQQLCKILSKDTKQAYDYVFVQVAASAVTQTLQTCADRTEKYLLSPILSPLREIDHSTEDQICTCINQMYNLCIVPSNSYFAVPVRVILPVSSILFFIYTQIKDSVWYLKSSVKQLLGKLLFEAEEYILFSLLDAMVFNLPCAQIFPVPTKKKIVLTANGGIRLEEGDANSELANSVLILTIIKDIDDNEKLTNSFFTYLLKQYVNFCSEENASKRVVIVILLTELSQDASTLRHILKNAENIIGFIQELLRIHCEKNDENEEVIRLCLTFLTMVLYDLRKKKDVKWNAFTPLLPYLKLKNSHSPDIVLLAEEVFNLITTRNVIGRSDCDIAAKVLIEQISKSACEIAIEEACDPLLPARAHALMELISLIKNADAETLAKKEKILCLFQENLKDKDSFLYLRAIEGLASLATLKPQDVLPLLCQEFILCSIPETRLKIGEILVRTVKLLNEFVSWHKKLLINTFLNGVKDEDCLVRASSLSNLGEVCSMLKSDIENVLYEILCCAQNVASSDKQVEPRRAAIFLISSLFRGLKHSMVKVLESKLLELYRTLKRIRATDEDDVVRAHVELALNALEDNMQEFFTVKSHLEKKINVLDAF